MSLDNVLAVAAIADGDTNMLVFGLGLGDRVDGICRNADHETVDHVIHGYSWLGLVVLLYVAGEMFYRGIFDPSRDSCHHGRCHMTIHYHRISNLRGLRSHFRVSSCSNTVSLINIRL